MSTVWIGNQRTELDARHEGSSVFVAQASSESSHYFDFIHSKCEFSGIEIYSEAQVLGDKLKLSIEYYVPPLDIWKRYKKFGKNFNVFPGHVNRVIMFPATPVLGTRIKLDYNNASNIDIKFAINVFKFTDLESVNPSLLEEGIDW